MNIKTDLPHPTRLIENTWIPMSDGCRLAARIWLPEDAEQNPVPAVMDYNPYRVLRGRRYKYVQNLAADLSPPLPTDLFRSTTWTAVRQKGVEAMGQRTTKHVLERSPEELYDMADDPAETQNRIADPALKNVVAQMRQQLYAFRRQTKDPWLEVDFQAGRIDETEMR